MKLMRRLLALSATNFDKSMARSLVSLANGGIEDKDRMLRACLAILSELGLCYISRTYCTIISKYCKIIVFCILVS